MAIHWGAYENHLRVGIAYTISPSSPSHSDTSVKVTWKFYVGTDGWNWADNQTLHSDITGEAGQSNNFYNGLTSGSKLVLTDAHNYAIDYNSGTANANCNISGAYNGATPSKSLTINLPNRPPGEPSKITDHHAQDIDTDSATIDWTAPNNNGDSIDAYHVQVDNNSGMGSPVLNVSNVSSTARATGNILSPNTTYYFRVRAKNSAGWGPWSTVKSFKTDGGLPTTPGTPTMVGRTSTSLDMGWVGSNANGGTGLTYTIERYADAGLTTLLETVSGLTGTTHNFTGLLAGTQYWFRVKATTSLGTSGYSGTGDGTTLGALAYNDPGPLTQHVVSLAEAVADKLAHLGMFVVRGRTSDVTLPEDTWTYLNMGTAVASRGPDEPTYDSGTTDDLTINYEGTYHIELRVGTPDANGFIGAVLVNGKDETDTAGEGGFEDSAGDDVVNGRALVTRGVRRLFVGDKLAFRVYNNSTASRTVNSLPGSDLTCYYRVTMIGF